jgi:hypothetical protein
MEFRKALLSAASVLALTAAVQSSANAAIPPDDAKTKTAVRGLAQADLFLQADPLFELMKRTNGSFAAGPIEDALREMFRDPSSVQVEAIPGLLAGLSGLGASSDVLTRLRHVLIDLVSAAPNVGEDVRGAALNELQGELSTFKLAKKEPRRRRRREPEEIGQVPGGGGAPAAAS